MKTTLLISILLMSLSISAAGSNFASGPASLTLAGGAHPGSELEFRLYPEVIVNAAGDSKGNYSAGIKANFLGLYLNGRDQTLFGAEARYRTQGSIGRFHVSTQHKFNDVTVHAGAFAGSDFGAWAMVDRGKFEVAIGEYDHLGSRAGLYYNLTDTSRVGVVYSVDLGVYASYTHTFRWRKP